MLLEIDVQGSTPSMYRAWEAGGSRMGGTAPLTTDTECCQCEGNRKEGIGGGRGGGMR